MAPCLILRMWTAGYSIAITILRSLFHLKKCCHCWIFQQNYQILWYIPNPLFLHLVQRWDLTTVFTGPCLSKIRSGVANARPTVEYHVLNAMYHSILYKNVTIFSGFSFKIAAKVERAVIASICFVKTAWTFISDFVISFWRFC